MHVGQTHRTSDNCQKPETSPQDMEARTLIQSLINRSVTNRSQGAKRATYALLINHNCVPTPLAVGKSCCIRTPKPGDGRCASDERVCRGNSFLLRVCSIPLARGSFCGMQTQYRERRTRDAALGFSPIAMTCADRPRSSFQRLN